MNRKLVLPAGAVLLLLSGCAASTPGEVSPAATATTVPTSSGADAACSELGVPASLSYNAWNDFHQGTITAEQRNNDLTEAAGAFRAVDASDVSGVQSALQQVIDYIDASSPDASGQPYDPGTDEFFNLSSGLGTACADAGSELVVKAHGG